MTTFNPLAELRRKGFDAELHQQRVRVWPRHKMTKSLAQFVTANLSAISGQLIAEANMKGIDNVFLWDLPAPQRTEAGVSEDPTAEEIPEYMNGESFAGFKAAAYD
ncbi:hypothetical protein ACH5Y9_11710 [Methylomonas sp. BW4-1]|uniref:hypothetical protein n=1 Tax=Methylomonas sp. BW4-1 TaxID=3376685 RepID=UPI004041F88C